MPSIRIQPKRLPDDLSEEEKEGLILAAVTRIAYPGSKLVENEWNFRRCPKSQLPYCKIYEYARESPSQRRKIAIWKKNDFSGFDKPIEPRINFEEHWRLNFFRLFPEFPKVPWLNMDSVKIEERISRMRSIAPIVLRTVSTQMFVYNGVIEEEMETFGFQHHGTIQAIEINWLANDKSLLSAFRKWLHDAREIKQREARGGRNKDLHLLNALAAKRLLEAHDNDFEAAFQISAEVLGKPLYSNQSKWLEAKRRAEVEYDGPVPPLAHLLRKTRDITGVFTSDEINKMTHYWIAKASASDQRRLMRLSRDKFIKQIRELTREYRLP
ncbi:MAG: hypothetical protein WCD79_14760 [Chthoniobacteraceae bacterium]